MTEDKHESAHSDARYPQALSRGIRIGIPIASILVLLSFASVLFLPANKATLPVQTTIVYIPVYIVIVVALVLGSMYVFKRLVDAETEAGIGV